MDLRSFQNYVNSRGLLKPEKEASDGTVTIGEENDDRDKSADDTETGDDNKVTDSLQDEGPVGGCGDESGKTARCTCGALICSFCLGFD